MRVFKCVRETKTCTASPPCQAYKVQRKECGHAQKVMLVDDGDIAVDRRGPQQRASSWVNQGTFAMVYEAEVSEWQPTLTEDEQAALRVGGNDALKRILAVKAREKRDAEHHKVEKGKCSCGLVWPCPVRTPMKPDVKHAQDPARPVCGDKGQYTWCICGKLWSHRCSKLKKVQKQLEKSKDAS